MNLDRLFNPRSIAVIGATERPSIGRSVMLSLDRLGFPGPVVPVNPRYESVLGRPCVADVGAAGTPIDLAVVCLGRDRALATLESAAASGVGAAVIFGGGYAEADAEGRRIQRALTDLCREAGIALCGPNCMGILSPHARLHAYMISLEVPEAFAGNVALVSQSGSVCIALSNDVRRFGFSHLISSGNEAVVGAADYLDFLVEDAETRAIALFTESVGAPERFVAGLDAAADAGKPVVALKVGRSARAAASVTTHTGGLAGEARVFSAVLAHHRAIEVRTLEEMSEVLAAVQADPLPSAASAGIVTASGGQAELMLDLAESTGVALPPLAKPLRERVEAVTGRVTGDGNPLDAWGNGDYATNFPAALAALADSDDHANVLLTLDGHDGQPIANGEMIRECAAIACAAKARSGKPHFVLSTLRGVFRTDQVGWLREGGVPVLSGIREALTAIGALVGRTRPATPERPVPPAMDEARARAYAARVTVHEHDAKRLLAEYGLPAPAESVAHSLDEALSAAGAIGYPVVLKVLSDRIAHRTDHGLVAVGIDDREAFADAWARVHESAAARDGAGELAWLVEPMIPAGVEVIIGVKRDPAFGQVLAVGPGGVLAEVVDDVSLRMLPLREGDADRMVEETRLAVLLAGVRGRPPADRRALVRAIEAVADFAAANAAWVESLDVNPVVVHSKGCLAADALIVPRRADGDL